MTLNEQPLPIGELRKVARAADADGRPWTWVASESRGKGGYPQNVLRVGDVVLVATCYDEPDYPAKFAEFIATFDPPTVLALLDRIGDEPGEDA